MLDKIKNIKLSRTVKRMLQGVMLCTLAFVTLTAVTFKQNGLVLGLDIQLEETASIQLVDKEYLKGILEREFASDLTGLPIEFVSTQDVEMIYNNNAYVKSAEVFINKNGILEIDVEERVPIVRVIDAGGRFYLDNEGVSVPLSDRYSARLPILFIPEEAAKFLTPERRQDIVRLMEGINGNSFMQALTDQIEMSISEEFIITPLLGNERIKLGTTDNLEDKLNRVELFYKKKISNGHWNQCAFIDVRFKGQVVCEKTKT